MELAIVFVQFSIALQGRARMENVERLTGVREEMCVHHMISGKLDNWNP
jgi:hypothetical protein